MYSIGVKNNIIFLDYPVQNWKPQTDTEYIKDSVQFVNQFSYIFFCSVIDESVYLSDFFFFSKLKILTWQND